MSSGEIEDVLTSIRRLVSEDLHPAPRPQIVSKMTVVEDKLILTPALRVVPRVASQKPAAPDAAVEPALRRPLSTIMPRLHLGASAEAGTTVPEVVATLAEAVDRQAEDRQTGGRLAGDRGTLDWESETGDPEPDMESLDWSSFTFARRTMQETWIARAAAAAAPEPVVSAARTWAQTETGPAADPAQAEFEPEPRHIGETQFDDTLDYSDAAPLADDRSEWADEAEAEVLADLNQSSAEAKPAASQTTAEVMPGVAQDEDNIFSEQVLRELVRDLIREQLQGDLGERITRNIRKLVKAEIARAMAVHALE